jgi:hypothetical protein
MRCPAPASNCAFRRRRRFAREDASLRDVHRFVPAQTVKDFTLSLAKQALSGKMDDAIETIGRSVRLA